MAVMTTGSSTTHTVVPTTRAFVLGNARLPSEVQHDLLATSVDRATLARNPFLDTDVFSELLDGSLREGTASTAIRDALLGYALPAERVQIAVELIANSKGPEWVLAAAATKLAAAHRLSDAQFDRLAWTFEASFERHGVTVDPLVKSAHVPTALRRRLAVHTGVAVRAALIVEHPGADRDDAELLLAPEEWEPVTLTAWDLRTLTILAAARPALAAEACNLVGDGAVVEHQRHLAWCALRVWNHDESLNERMLNRLRSVGDDPRNTGLYVELGTQYDPDAPTEVVGRVLARATRSPQQQVVDPFADGRGTGTDPDAETLEAVLVSAKAAAHLWAHPATRRHGLLDLALASVAGQPNAPYNHGALVDASCNGGSPWGPKLTQGVFSVEDAPVRDEVRLDGEELLGDDLWKWRLALELFNNGALGFAEAAATAVTAVH